MTRPLAFFFLIACGGPSARDIHPAPRPPTADYEVHEWGLVRAEAGDVLRVGAIAPPLPPQVLTVDKPVLYFHSAAPLEIETLTVRATGGAILEHWPLTSGHETSAVVWNGVRIDGDACAPSPLPSAQQACASLPPGSFCETPELAIVRTDDAACVRVGGSTERFLFYRAEARAFTPPLAFARTHVYEDVSVRNDGDDPIPGVIVRIWTDGNTTRALTARPPAPHQSIVIGHDFDAADGDEVDAPRDMRVSTRGSDAIRRTMRELGLTASEADAFVRAWEPTLFLAGTTDVDRLSADIELAPRETFLYFIPERAADGLATITIDPPPRAVRRAIAVWTTLRATGEAR